MCGVIFYLALSDIVMCSTTRAEGFAYYAQLRHFAQIQHLRVNGRSARSGGITRDFAHAPLAPIHYAVARVRELAS